MIVSLVVSSGDLLCNFRKRRIKRRIVLFRFLFLSALFFRFNFPSSQFELLLYASSAWMLVDRMYDPSVAVVAVVDLLLVSQSWLSLVEASSAPLAPI